MRGTRGIEFFAQSFDRKIEPGEGFPYSARDPTSVFVLPQRRRASVEAKIRIECIVRSSTRALRDRRLNSLYRRIIANENIGCAEITNGRGADEMHNRTTFRPISSAKKYSLDGLFTSFQNVLLLSTIRTINNLFALRSCFSFALEYYPSNWMN